MVFIQIQLPILNFHIPVRHLVPNSILMLTMLGYFMSIEEYILFCLCKCLLTLQA